MIDLGRERAIYLYLLIAGSLAFRRRRIVEIRESDGALDLQSAGPFEENGCPVCIDAVDARMRRRVGQKCEDPVLQFGIGWGRSCHAPDLDFEHRGTQELPRPELVENFVGLDKRECRGLGPDPDLWNDFQ